MIGIECCGKLAFVLIMQFYHLTKSLKRKVGHWKSQRGMPMPYRSTADRDPVRDGSGSILMEFV